MRRKPDHPSSPRLTHWGLCLAAFLVPVVWTESVVASFTLPKLAVLAAAVLACALGQAFLRGEPRRTPLGLPLAACAAALAASAAFSQDRLLSVMGMYNHYAFGVWPLLLCAALYVFAAREGSEERQRSVLGWALAAGSVLGAHALLQVAGKDPLLSVPLPAGRAISTTGSPVHLGASLALLLPLALSWALPAGGFRASRALPLAAIAAGLLASGSRGAWAGGAAGCLLFVAVSGRLEALRTARSRWLAAGAVALLVLAGGVRLVVRPASAGGEGARVAIWGTAWRAFLEHPVLGSGPDTFEQSFRRLKPLSYLKARTSLEYQANAHNDLLQALATTGLAGAAAYAWLLAALALAAWRRLRSAPDRALPAALAGGLLSYFVVMKSNPMPLEGFALAALLAGFLAPAEPEARPLPSWMTAAASALGLASALFAFRLLAADYQMKVGANRQASGLPDAALPRYETGLRLNPWEPSYHITYVNLLSQRAAATPIEGLRLELLERAERSGRLMVSQHPSDMRSHYIYGVASLMQARVGLADRLAVAERELDAAVALEPFLRSLLQTRLETAQLRGDKAAAAALQARIDELDRR